MFKEIADMLTLEEDWDSYGALPPSQLAADNANKFLSVVQNSELQRKIRVDPSVEGGIGVTFGSIPHFAYIEFYNDGECILTLSGKDEFPKSEVVILDAGFAQRTIAIITAFLKNQ